MGIYLVKKRNLRQARFGWLDALLDEPLHGGSKRQADKHLDRFTWHKGDIVLTKPVPKPGSKLP